MKQPVQIMIHFESGGIQNISNIPEGCEILLCDFDLPGEMPSPWDLKTLCHISKFIHTQNNDLPHYEFANHAADF